MEYGREVTKPTMDFLSSTQALLAWLRYVYLMWPIVKALTGAITNCLNLDDCQAGAFLNYYKKTVKN